MSQAFHDPSIIMRVAKEHAWSLAKPIALGVWSLAIIFSIFVRQEMPEMIHWLTSTMLGLLAGSIVWFYIYKAKGLDVIHLILEVDHVEQTQGVTMGDYSIQRNPPTPASTAR